MNYRSLLRKRSYSWWNDESLIFLWLFLVTSCLLFVKITEDKILWMLCTLCFWVKGPAELCPVIPCLLPIDYGKVTSSLLQRHWVLLLRLRVRINMPHLLKKASLEELRVQFQFHFRSISSLVFFQICGTGEISGWHRHKVGITKQQIRFTVLTLADQSQLQF